MAELPRGTVTFLFTDIESSTELARLVGASYPELMTTHFDIISSIVESSSGVVVKNTGDGVFAAFASVADALRSAADIQIEMSAQHWPLGVEIKLRVGMHTGQATVHDHDYVGIDVHRAARVMAAGHGGQILLSETVRSIAGEGLEFRDLGRHLLKGLEHEETIYQLVVPGLPEEFPPLATTSSARNNLPARAASIVGRDDDRRSLGELVDRDRLVTVLGPGGVGKTSLALSVAGDSIDRFPGGVTFVDFSAVRDPEYVIPSIASELAAEPKTVDGVVRRLHGSRSLLVLDNLEQVVGSAQDIGHLVEASPEAHFLVTSQVPLRLAGEQRYVLGSLGDGVDSPGVDLFLERARSVNPMFEADPSVVADVVGLVDGLPLAIELLAARANIMTADQILERLQSGQMSYAPRADSPERHRSLDAALEWSYDLLDDGTRDVFRRLGVFAGGFTLEAAEQVAAASGLDVVGEIAELVDRSLVTRRLDSAGRFRMLPGIRRFASDRLDESDGATATREGYVDFYCALGNGAFRGLQGDSGHWWQTRLDEEIDNLREVLTVLEQDGRVRDGLGLLGNLWRFYVSRGYIFEIEEWLGTFFALADSLDEGVEVVKGLMGRGAVEYWSHRGPESVAAYRQAVEMARRVGDDALLADALFGLGTALVIDERHDEAIPLFDESKALYSEIGDDGGLADVLAGEAFSLAATRGLAGQGPLFEETARLYEAAGRRVQKTQVLYAQAAAAIVEGRLDDARDRVVEGVQIGIDLHDVYLQAWGVDYLSLLDFEAGDHRRAGLLSGACEAAQASLGLVWGPELLGIDNGGTRLRKSLGDFAAERLIAPGRELTIEEAAELGMSPPTSSV